MNNGMNLSTLDTENLNKLKMKQRIFSEMNDGFEDVDNREREDCENTDVNQDSHIPSSSEKRVNVTNDSVNGPTVGTPATPEYKLLQLRQYLSGEALKAVENLGHSSIAYEAAKDRLERKFGGQRRQVMRHREQLDSFRPIRVGNSKDLEKFADILDIAVINLKDAGRTDELKNGSLYVKLQKKIPESLLSTYHRWVYEKTKTESVESLREWILQESEFRTVANETVYGLQFKKLKVSQKWNFVRQSKLCFRCLGSGHLGKTCRRSRPCGIDHCTETHHRLLHIGNRAVNQNTDGYQRDLSASVLNQNAPEFRPFRNPQRPTSSVRTAENSNVDTQISVNQDRTLTCHGGEPQFIALRTIPVIVRNGSKTMRVNALLDDASTRTYINADVAAELGLHGKLQRITVGVLNDKTESFETMPVEFQIESINGRTKTKVEALTADKVTGDMCVINWRKYQHKWDHLRGLEFPGVGKHSMVDILIGMDHSELHYAYQEIRGRPDEPVARLTPLRWTCVGKIPGSNEICVQTHFNRTYFIQNQKSDNESDKILCKFWEMENFSEPQKKQSFSPEERSAYEKVKDSLKFVDDHYEVAIPWKEEKPDLPCNYDMALQRLENTEKRLMKNPEVRDSYSKTIEQYLEKGYIRKINQDEEKSGKLFLPHFPVIRPDKSTTKTRIVFDASAKHCGVSLNDMIHCGPKLQNELFDVLLRFRRNSVAIVCDIAEMYLKIKVPQEDRPYQQFLWRDVNTEEKPDVYEFSSVVFGINSSPFQAQFVAQSHAETNRETYPMAAETVLKSTYMDDSMDSVSTEEDGVILYRQLSALWEKAGMYARKWLSNSVGVLQHIPTEDVVPEVDLHDNSLPSVKTLGVLWKAKDDIFTFKASPPEDDFTYTKRNFLRKISMLFGPLGFLGPYTIRAKVLLQEMWTAGLDWDDVLSEDLISKAEKWFRELTELSLIEVPRCLRPSNGEIISTYLHTFVDASQDAYGAVVYQRCIYDNGSVSVRFVTAKSKVAPLTAVSIPRMELMGAVLGLRLTLSVTSALEMNGDQCTFWTDSMNVLCWIKAQSRSFKPFVANRIGEIQSASNPKQWHHVPTEINPADMISRGVTVSQLQKDSVWWSGPHFLTLDDSQWPNQKVEKQDRKKLSREVVNDSYSFLARSVGFRDVECCLNPESYSSWIRLVRIQARTKRFVNNCRMSIKDRFKGELNAEEVEEAETQIIRTAQKCEFHCEYRLLKQSKPLHQSSKLLSLNPVLDEDGLLRCDGRLKYAEYLPYDVRYPVILPRNNRVTTLIKYHHEKGKHVTGTNHTLSMISSRFWIISAREEIRKWERQCNKCCRNKARPAEQLMGPLPSIRVHEIMIKAAKRANYAVIGSADVTDEELMTAFAGAEALINSRPLTYQSANPNDDVPLTPNHFLHGQVGGLFAPETVDTTKFNPRKCWRRIQELVRHFWHRWMREWLPGLNVRKKWNRTCKDISEGNFVDVQAIKGGENVPKINTSGSGCQLFSV
uniref:CCHC-type domain-containing protein n=1 Tax=Magallana gigas TaxID=29159 RepID=A0A8W8P1X9_MAGGI